MFNINCLVYFLGYIMEGFVICIFLVKVLVFKGFLKVFLKIVVNLLCFVFIKVGFYRVYLDDF